MSTFLLMYVGVFGTMNAVLSWRVWRAWPDQPRLWIFAALFGLAVMLMPFPARALEARLPILSDLFALLTFTWLILVFWFLGLSIAADLWNGIIWALQHTALNWPERLMIPPRVFFIAASSLIGIATLWGIIEAQTLGVEKVTFTPKNSTLARPLRIVQVSDLHLGRFWANGRLKRVVRLIEEQHPDMIVATGDIIDVEPERLQEQIAPLAALQPILGKYAVTGNHEAYSGTDAARKWHEAAGFTMLQGEQVALSEIGMVVAGVDDPAILRQTSREVAESDILPPAGPDQPFTLLLKHQPHLDEGALGRFDLQLSGHIHGGQVFPFRWIVSTVYHYEAGHNHLPGEALLHVSRGTGSWGTPLRLWAPPHLTVIDVTP